MIKDRRSLDWEIAFVVLMDKVDKVLVGWKVCMFPAKNETLARAYFLRIAAIEIGV